MADDAHSLVSVALQIVSPLSDDGPGRHSEHEVYKEVYSMSEISKLTL